MVTYNGQCQSLMGNVAKTTSPVVSSMRLVGKLWDTTNLKAIAVKRSVRVTLSRSDGSDISTENEQNDRISIRNCSEKE